MSEDTIDDDQHMAGGAHRGAGMGPAMGPQGNLATVKQSSAQEGQENSVAMNINIMTVAEKEGQQKSVILSQCVECLSSSIVANIDGWTNCEVAGI